jgi:glycosyltransferase involved in cell wall biosynthesis
MAVYYGNPMNLSPKKQPEFDEAKANPEGNVLFFDAVKDVGSVYSGIDVLMLASNHEAFSLTMIEAWIAGVPVVSTNAGAVPELQERFGQLVIEVPPNPTGEQLAAACQRAMSPEGKLLADKARKLAYKHFTASAMLDKWEAYFKSVVYPDVKPKLLELDI